MYVIMQQPNPQQLDLSVIIPNMAAGLAGRYYFGGIGGGLLGVALYNVFVKPLAESYKKAATKPTLP